MSNLHVRAPRPALKYVRQGAGIVGLALLLTGCFQSAAGDSVRPTTVDLTAMATLAMPSATPSPFITPLPTTGFLTPTTDPNQVLLPTPTAIIVPMDTTPTELPTVDVDSISSTATLSVATLLPSPTQLVSGLPATPTGLPTDGPCIHTVQQGEWMYAIARKYNISVEDLIAANPNINPNALQIGDQLNIPSCNKTNLPTPLANATPTMNTNASGDSGNSSNSLPTPIMVSDRVYTVKSGDTLGSIAFRFDVTVEALKAANNLTNDFLQIGQQLKIPQPVQPTPQ